MVKNKNTSNKKQRFQMRFDWSKRKTTTTNTTTPRCGPKRCAHIFVTYFGSICSRIAVAQETQFTKNLNSMKKKKAKTSNRGLASSPQMLWAFSCELVDPRHQVNAIANQHTHQTNNVMRTLLRTMFIFYRMFQLLDKFAFAIVELRTNKRTTTHKEWGTVKTTHSNRFWRIVFWHKIYAKSSAYPVIRIEWKCLSQMKYNTWRARCMPKCGCCCCCYFLFSATAATVFHVFSSLSVCFYLFLARL